MTGITDLTQLLNSMEPKLVDGAFVFCTVEGVLSDYYQLNPIATFVESEGLTLVLLKEVAENAKLDYDSIFKQITLTVHSSLDAVGLTAAISNKLADNGISANVIAAYFHDHIFVQEEKAESALLALAEFSV